MILDAIHSFFSIDIPAKDTEEYKDFITSAFLWFVSFILIAAFFPDVINYFKKKNKE